LEACINLGIDKDELHFISLKKFKKDNPDIFGLESEILNMRWGHENKNRKKLRDEVKKVIKILILLI
jgi:hypothetical protein